MEADPGKELHDLEGPEQQCVCASTLEAVGELECRNQNLTHLV